MAEGRKAFLERFAEIYEGAGGGVSAAGPRRPPAGRRGAAAEDLRLRVRGLRKLLVRENDGGAAAIRSGGD
jgi:hypothetical protein